MNDICDTHQCVDMFSHTVIIILVEEQRSQKEEGTGSRITTFVCMSKINHWGVGVTKLRDMTSSEMCAICTRRHFSRWPPSTFRIQYLRYCAV